MSEKIIKKLKNAPSLPGVYLFKDIKGNPIYIGKAANLLKRLKTYVSRDNARNALIFSRAHSIDTIVTDSDTEALTLEESLIKIHKPRYNVRLKDDKKFPYLKITARDDFPKILFTRDISPDGSLLFGPYTNAKAVRYTRDALCRIFKLASCTRDLSKNYVRPCLERNMKRCSAPCVSAITKTEYANLVSKAVAFLKGKTGELEKEIERAMWQCAKKENFEAATLLRDQLLSMRKMSQRQRIVPELDKNTDIIGFYRTGSLCLACLFRIRSNKLETKEIIPMKITPQIENEEIASAFIRIIYTHISYVPEQIIISAMPTDWKIQQKWFKEKGFQVCVPHRILGEKKRLLHWAEQNAENEMAKRMYKKRIPLALVNLRERLHLTHVPVWIEAFDISNIKEKYAVGSSVSFIDGKPSKKRYRRYRIKRVEGQNDVAMMHEIMVRRLRFLKKQNHFPSLLLVDGGVGQLHAAFKALKKMKITIPVFALAKKHDTLYDSSGRILTLPTSSRAIYLLKRIRDEAHRFAIKYHRTIRGKNAIFSVLDSVPGVGPKRKLILLKFFGSVEAIKKASKDDIIRVPGIGRKTAHILFEHLHS